MKSSKFIGLLLCLFAGLFLRTELQAQDLDQHLWKERVILILSEDSSNPDFLKQVTELHNAKEGLEQRRLVVYQVNAEGASKLFPGKAVVAATRLNEKFQMPLNGMKFVLIGLDGGIKYTSNSPVSSGVLFAEIDKMPLRRNELNKSNGF